MSLTPDYAHGAEVLKEYKNKNRDRFEGKRCFIIGNGPSLKAEDLDKIKDEFSIACNRIYLIFGQTEWRPNIFAATDRKFIEISIPEMSELQAELKILAVPPNIEMYPVDGAIAIKAVVNANDWMRTGKLPPFSDDVTECVYHGMSITYTNIQIAAWLGFKEIILMGMDHQYRRHWHVLTPSVRALLADQLKDRPGFHGRIIETKGVERDHFCSEYVDGFVSARGDQFTDYCVDEVTRAYMSAKKYAEAHGIKIFNATRGGKLEIFERINFDRLVSILNQKKNEKDNKNGESAENKNININIKNIKKNIKTEKTAAPNGFKRLKNKRIKK